MSDFDTAWLCTLPAHADAFADDDLLIEFGTVNNPQQAAEIQARLEERRAAAAAATTSGSSGSASSSKSKKAFVPRKLRKSQLPLEALPKVAIIGRPNVGKSALFNRLAGSSLAVVFDYPGVTRDRLYTRAFWGDKEYCLIDTGASLRLQQQQQWRSLQQQRPGCLQQQKQRTSRGLLVLARVLCGACNLARHGFFAADLAAARCLAPHYAAPLCSLSTMS